MALASCAEELYRLTKGSEEFDFQASVDLCADLRDLHRKASDFQALGENMDAFTAINSAGVDVEMECVIMHYLALVFGCMSLTTQCRDMHKKCVLKGLSLDPNCTEWNKPTRPLQQRTWFVKSMHYVKKAQQRDIAAAEADRSNQLKEIKEELEKIEETSEEGMLPFLRYIFANHPPPAGVKLDPVFYQDEVDLSTAKIKYLKMTRMYHPDKLVNVERKEKLLCEEIVKHLNNFFAKKFKGVSV